jgi:hypothetical protein
VRCDGQADGRREEEDAAVSPVPCPRPGKVPRGEHFGLRLNERGGGGWRT